jgi:hypothetical protein
MANSVAGTGTNKAEIVSGIDFVFDLGLRRRTLHGDHKFVQQDFQIFVNL